MMEVYADILFFTNFVMDFLIMKISADILSVKPRLWRVGAAAAAGGIFGVCFFIPDFNFAGTAATSFFEAAFMAFAVFWPCGVKEYFKRIAVMYMVSVILAGAVFFDMMVFEGGVIKNGIFYTSTPRVVIAAGVVYVSAKSAVSKLKRRASQKISGVVIEFMGKKVRAEAFTDTGNGLTEPITKKPVMLIETAVLKKLAGEGCGPNNLCEWIESDRIRFIPYHTIDCDGVLAGIVLDRVYIDGRCIENAVAAVCDKNLKYPVILHAGM